MSMYYERVSIDQKQALGISPFESISMLIDQDLSSSAKHESRDIPVRKHRTKSGRQRQQRVDFGMLQTSPRSLIRD